MGIYTETIRDRRERPAFVRVSSPNVANLETVRELLLSLKGITISNHVSGSPTPTSSHGDGVRNVLVESVELAIEKIRNPQQQG